MANRNLLYTFVQAILRSTGLALVKKQDLDNYAKVLEILSKPDNRRYTGSAECIVFSMDRALQLHAFLSSYFENVRNHVPVHLFYRTSNAQHQRSYDEVIEIFSGRMASVIKQRPIQEPFREKLSEILESIKTPKMMFFLDDDLFIDEVDMNDYTKYATDSFIPSLRLAPHLRKCYTFQKEQVVPREAVGIISEPDKFCWQWRDGEYDWAIPFSIDGNAFSTKEITLISKSIPFAAPNSFESNLLQFTKMFNFRYGVCYLKSKIVNIPCNMVQKEINNLRGTMHQDALLEKWNSGLQMDFRKFYGFLNESAHQNLKLQFIKRGS